MTVLYLIVIICCIVYTVYGFKKERCKEKFRTLKGIATTITLISLSIVIGRLIYHQNPIFWIILTFLWGFMIYDNNKSLEEIEE